MATLSRRQWLAGAAAAPGLTVADTRAHGAEHGEGLRPLLEGLLRDWCDGLLRQQVVDPRRPAADGEDVPLTPRVEIRVADGTWLTNLFDRRATITHAEDAGRVVVTVEARLENEAGDAGGAAAIRIRYAFDASCVEIAATGLPPAARLVLETQGRWRRIPTARPRAFNHVPGFEAVPFETPTDAAGAAIARLRVRA